MKFRLNGMNFFSKSGRDPLKLTSNNVPASVLIKMGKVMDLHVHILILPK